MTKPIVECIANYSEARRPEVVEEIMQTVISVPGVLLLDRHSDLDHNRTVLSFVGEPGKIEEAAFRSIETAARLINLNEHSGEHPRIGATDVVPFVPISGVTMQECVEIARRLGKRVGEELGIPVYLYEEAATIPERQNLEYIRRGQFEALKAEMGVDPQRDPDFGPKRVGTAGATVIGARQPLIAFNIYLNNDDVNVARQVAKAVRHSSGGLRYVKALGILVEGRAQVSMNLTNFRGTPLSRVVEAVRREAARYGATIHHSELVGLIPQEALLDAAAWYIQLDDFDPEKQILEQRIASAMAEQASPEQATFLERLAEATPTPGGGCAAAYSGAAGAALVAMVARLTIDRKKYAEVQAEMEQILEKAETFRAQLTELIDRDAMAFNSVMNAFRLPKDTPQQEAQRQQAIQSAYEQAARIPLEVAEKSVEVMFLALEAITSGNLNAISDGAVGATLAHAALTGAAYNVQINLSELADGPTRHQLDHRITELVADGQRLNNEVRQVLQERGGIHLA